MKKRWLIGIAVSLLCCAFVALGAWWALRNTHRGSSPNRSDEQAALSETVKLPEGASVRVQEVQEAPWQDIVYVSGRIIYDETRHVEVLATTAATIQQIAVSPGERVHRGQVLALLSSPEVAAARAEVALREEERRLAEQQWRWDETTFTNAEALIAAIEQGIDLGELERQFADQILGEAREKLLGAYARLRAAETLVSAARPLAEERTLPLPTLVQRQMERQTAAAALAGACERLRFDLRKTRDQSQIALNDARRRWEVSRQRLTSLLGYEESGTVATDDPAAWSRSEVRSPMAGTLERRYKAVYERVQPGEPLFLVADTSRLWCRAEVREQDWLAVRVQPGQELNVQFPGQVPRLVPGTVVLVGREASPQTNTIPLYVALDNSDGALRPGMFARVAIPMGASRRVLRVPAASVLTHEGETFVFVANSDGTYSRRAITAGPSNEEWVCVEKGLQVGEQVVAEGSFLLKSAMLLESEPE